MLDRLTLPLVGVLAVVLLVWYLAGNELMRRRGSRLAVWCKRAADNMGGKQAIKWFTLHSFRLEIEQVTTPIIRSAVLTGLVESWDVPVIWLWNRMNWRRDMVLAQLVLATQPMAGLELYRPGAILAGDAQHAARQEGWEEEPLDEFRIAPATERSQKLARQLLTDLEAQRPHLIRLSVRRRDTHLSLALNVPEPAAFRPEAFYELLSRLASTVDHA